MIKDYIIYYYIRLRLDYLKWYLLLNRAYDHADFVTQRQNFQEYVKNKFMNNV